MGKTQRCSPNDGFNIASHPQGLKWLLICLICSLFWLKNTEQNRMGEKKQNVKLNKLVNCLKNYSPIQFVNALTTTVPFFLQSVLKLASVKYRLRQKLQKLFTVCYCRPPSLRLFRTLAPVYLGALFYYLQNSTGRIFAMELPSNRNWLMIRWI